jgi:hypothetical protein
MMRTEAPRKSDPKTSLGDRWGRLFLVFELGTLAFITSALPIVTHLWRRGEDRMPVYVVGLLVPSSAAMLLVIALVMMPSILAVNRIRWPLNVTIPLLFAQFAWLVSEIGLATQSSLVSGPDMLQIARLGATPRLLAAAMIAQFVCLSLLSLIRWEKPSEPRG